jgi:2-polyprenyl-3-methyl-5-hydroxy-6-metoxy-1,4-benzoquinol methylase
MRDLFKQKAADWDERPIPLIISEAVGGLLRAEIPWEPDWRVMDFGAGTGLVASHIAPLVGHIGAVDISAAMLEKLAAKPELAGKVHIHCRDLIAEPLGEVFDVIVSAMALHHVEDTSALLRTFRDHLAPGGRLALADLDAEDGSFHPPGTEAVFHPGFDRDELAAKFRRAGFEDVAFQTAVEVVRESGQAYPVFLVTARAAA